MKVIIRRFNTEIMPERVQNRLKTVKSKHKPDYCQNLGVNQSFLCVRNWWRNIYLLQSLSNELLVISVKFESKK